MTTDPRELDSRDLVDYLHPTDAPSRQHTISAAYQAADLLRYLAHCTGDASAAAVPTPVVANDVVLALRDGLPALGTVLRHLGERMETFTADGADHRAAASVAATLTEAAENADVLAELLRDAGNLGAQVRLRGR